MPPSRPTTPIRRISRGSLSALSHSRGAADGLASSSASAGGHHSDNDANLLPTPLSFLDESVGYLSDETSTLLTNLSDLSEIHTALNTFNEGFSMFLYGLKVAAYCIEWEDSPQVESFQRAKERTEQYSSLGSSHRRNGRRSSTSGIPVLSSDHRPTSPYYPAVAADQTYITQDEEPSFERRGPRAAPSQTAPSTKSGGHVVGKAPQSTVLKSAMRKPSASTAGTSTSKNPQSTTPAPVAKPKITVAQKKKREKYAGEVVETLPLEYRGSDPTARKLAESVVMALISARDKGAKIGDIVNPPQLPQAKVNKCLIALTNAKHVIKGSNNGIVYMLNPDRHPQLPP